MNSPSPPSGRYYPNFAYDSQSKVAILFGGMSEGRKNDTWVYKYQTNVPSEPRDLQAILTNGHVNLTWIQPRTDAGSPIMSYIVYRGTNLDSLVSYGTVQGKETLTYIDSEVSKGATYYYAIRAKNAVGESKDSITVEIKIPSAAPGFSLLILSFSLVIYIVVKRKS
jgi:hypothetical protein